jgi:hypothetical protein
MPDIAPDDPAVAEEQRARQIWKQKWVPVIFRPGGQRNLMVKLHEGHRMKPRWNEHFECWEVPRSWFEDAARRLLRRFGRVYTIQPFRLQEKCAPACWDAIGLKCECSCMGENHGSGNPAGRWYVVSETFAVRWHERRYGCRLIELPEPSTATH